MIYVTKDDKFYIEDPRGYGEGAVPMPDMDTPDLFKLLQPKVKSGKWVEGSKESKSVKTAMLLERKQHLIDDAKAAIDSAAEDLTAQYAAAKPQSRQKSYDDKYAEASGWLANKKHPTPLLDEEVGVLGVKKKAQAEIIVRKYERVQSIARKQDLVRLKFKQIVRGAGTYPDMLRAVSEVSSELVGCRDAVDNVGGKGGEDPDGIVDS